MTLDSIDQNDPTQSHQHCAVVDDLSAGHRLDQVAAKLFAEFSRSRLQQWIKSGELLVDGAPKSVDYRLKGGEELVICAAQTRRMGVRVGERKLLVSQSVTGWEVDWWQKSKHVVPGDYKPYCDHHPICHAQELF